MRDEPVVILCGGRGERLGDLTRDRPKPLVEVGGHPILWQIMYHFWQHGFWDFKLALGYLGWAVRWYFEDPLCRPPQWRVSCIPTGERTQNGGRLLRLKPLLDRTFLMAWCDGVSDIDLTRMLAFHRSHGRLCTVAAVHPPGRFGELVLDEDRVQTFAEKPAQSRGWVNGGFFACEPGVMRYVEGDDTRWELAPMQRLAQDDQLRAFRHEGFWQCMDTDRDRQALEEAWQGRRLA